MQDFEKKLQALVPTTSQRDQVLFLMGQASVKPVNRWLWPSLSLVLAMIALGLAVALYWVSVREKQVVPQIIYVDRIISVPATSPASPPSDIPQQPEPNLREKYPSPWVKRDPQEVDPVTIRYQQIHRELLQFGIDALPQVPLYETNHSQVSSSVIRQDLSEWLGVSPNELGFKKE